MRGPFVRRYGIDGERRCRDLRVCRSESGVSMGGGGGDRSVASGDSRVVLYPHSWERVSRGRVCVVMLVGNGNFLEAHHRYL